MRPEERRGPERRSTAFGGLFTFRLARSGGAMVKVGVLGGGVAGRIVPGVRRATVRDTVPVGRGVLLRGRSIIVCRVGRKTVRAIVHRVRGGVRALSSGWRCPLGRVTASFSRPAAVRIPMRRTVDRDGDWDRRHNLGDAASSSVGIDSCLIFGGAAARAVLEVAIPPLFWVWRLVGGLLDTTHVVVLIEMTSHGVIPIFHFLVRLRREAALGHAFGEEAAIGFGNVVELHGFLQEVDAFFGREEQLQCLPSCEAMRG